MSSLSRHFARATRASFSPITHSLTAGAQARFFSRGSAKPAAADAPSFAGRLVKPGLFDRFQPMLTHYRE